MQFNSLNDIYCCCCCCCVSNVVYNESVIHCAAFADTDAFGHHYIQRDEKYICPVGSGPTGSGAPQERTLRLYSGAGGVECDPDASFYGECPSNTIEGSHSSYSYGDDRFDPFANMPAGWVA